ncbi:MULTISPECIES: thiamine phosphate synthase [unclassified Nocardioides]|uniref:thiamine phosphate synthase n=1 Tax=unclassified Nocardioides TaxID=2615069 RepID=UPI00361EF6EA
MITPVVPVDLLGALVAAGVGAIQVRDKSLDDRSLLAFVTAAVEAVRPAGGLLIVNDRVDVALAAGADGVHLGAEDLPVRAARALAPDLVIGATCRSRAAVLEARAAGASYAGVGPVFATSSKAGLPEPLGVDGLASVTGVLPVVAIAGITAERVPAVIAAGAHGVAVLGAVSRAPDPCQAAKEIAAALPAA